MHSHGRIRKPPFFIFIFLLFCAVAAANGTEGLWVYFKSTLSKARLSDIAEWENSHKTALVPPGGTDERKKNDDSFLVKDCTS